MKRTLLAWFALFLSVALLTGAILIFRPQKAPILRSAVCYSPSPQQSSFLNTADSDALETLPGIGEVLSARIIAYREEHGGYASPDELIFVDGIGEKTLEKIKQYLSSEKGNPNP